MELNRLAKKLGLQVPPPSEEDEEESSLRSIDLCSSSGDVSEDPDPGTPTTPEEKLEERLGGVSWRNWRRGSVGSLGEEVRWGLSLLASIRHTEGKKLKLINSASCLVRFF